LGVAVQAVGFCEKKFDRLRRRFLLFSFVLRLAVFCLPAGAKDKGIKD
jgi:hypothetical protein